MTLDRLIEMLAITTLSALLAACATSESPSTANATAPHRGKDKAREQQQLKFQLASGVYRCELGQRVEIRRDARDATLIQINWQGNQHTLQRYSSASGLPRYEDRQNGLLWIDLPWKSVLMDVNSGRPLANECKAVPGKMTESRRWPGPGPGA